MQLHLKACDGDLRLIMNRLYLHVHDNHIRLIVQPYLLLVWLNTCFLQEVLL